jgi:hypothetical protein
MYFRSVCCLLELVTNKTISLCEEISLVYEYKVAEFSSHSLLTL